MLFTGIYIVQIITDSQIIEYISLPACTGIQSLKIDKQNRSIWVADWLALPTLDHKVPGLNPAGGRISAFDCTAFHSTEPFIFLI